MKQASYFLLSLAALMGLAACSSDNDLLPSGGEGNAVTVRASVSRGSIFSRTMPTGTADEQARFAIGDEIALSDGQKTVNYTLAADGTTWNATTRGQFLAWGSGQKTFKAYYPIADNGRGTTNSYDQGCVMDEQRTLDALAQSDYMTATATTTTVPGDFTLNLSFERKTARVIVRIAGYANQFDGLNPTIRNFFIQGYTTATALTNVVPYTVSGGTEYVALLMPHAAESNKLFLTMTVAHAADAAGKTETQLALWGIPELEAGKSYTFNLTLGKEKVTLNDVTVEDWAQGAIIPGGEAKECVLANVTAGDLGKLVTADGRIYATESEVTAAGRRAVAMIAYVGDDTGSETYNRGLAIALNNAKTSGARSNGEDVISNATQALNLYKSRVAAPQASSGWRMPSVNDLKRIFAAFGGNAYTVDGPTDQQRWSSGNFITKLTECGGKGFPESPAQVYNNYNIYTTDVFELSGKTYNWTYKATSSPYWTGLASGGYASLRPVFAF